VIEIGTCACLLFARLYFSFVLHVSAAGLSHNPFCNFMQTRNEESESRSSHVTAVPGLLCSTGCPTPSGMGNMSAAIHFCLLFFFAGFWVLVTDKCQCH
jgi:hypothetical protein